MKKNIIVSIIIISIIIYIIAMIYLFNGVPIEHSILTNSINIPVINTCNGFKC